MFPGHFARLRSRDPFPLRASIRLGRSSSPACHISQGNGNRFEERRCETAVGNTPSACSSLSAIGSSLWCPTLMGHPYPSSASAFSSVLPSLRRPSPRLSLFFQSPPNIFSSTSRVVIFCRSKEDWTYSDLSPRQRWGRMPISSYFSLSNWYWIAMEEGSETSIMLSSFLG